MLDWIIGVVIRRALARYGASAEEAAQLAPEVIGKLKGLLDLFKKLKAIGTPPDRAAKLVGSSITEPADHYAGMTPAEAEVFFDHGPGG